MVLAAIDKVPGQKTGNYCISDLSHFFDPVITTPSLFFCDHPACELFFVHNSIDHKIFYGVLFTATLLLDRFFRDAGNCICEWALSG